MGWLILDALAKLFGMCLVFAHWEWRQEMDRLERAGMLLPCARVVRR